MTRPAAVAFTVAFIASSAAAVPLPALSFSAPAQLDGAVETSNLQWALVYLSDSASVHLSELAEGAILNKTFTGATVQAQAIGQYEVPAGWQPADRLTLPPSFSATLTFRPERPAALLVVADSLTIAADSWRGQMVRTTSGDDAEAPLASRPNTPASYARPMGVDGVGLGLQTPLGSSTGFRIAAHGVRVVEWFGASVACSVKDDCPAGGGTWNEAVATPGEAWASATRRSWMHLTAANGLIEGSGSAWAIAAGGTALDVRVDGSVRLPHADHEGACPDCMELADGTLGLTGNLTLRSLTRDGQPGRLRFGLEGLPDAARVDETGVEAASLFGLGPVVAGAAVVAALAAKFLLGLFARAVQDPLANPRRKAIYDAVRAHPGLAFSDLLRFSGLANGVARHHLHLLERKGLIVRHPVGKTVRLFENHGRYDRDWRTIAALRDPQLRLLHAWLKAAGPSRQLDAIRAAAEWGWNPTATKRRLASLTGVGLVGSRREGRLRWYTAHG